MNPSDMEEFTTIWQRADDIAESLEAFTQQQIDREKQGERVHLKKMAEIHSLLNTLTRLRKNGKMREKELFEQEKKIIPYLPAGWSLLLIVDEQNCRYALAPEEK